MAEGNFICDKVQRAAWMLIRASNPSTVPNDNIYKGLENLVTTGNETEEDVRRLPCVVCVCQSAEILANDIDSLQWEATLRIEIRSNADDTTDATHHERAQEIINMISTDTIATDLSNAQEDFTAFLVLPRSQSWDLQSRSWVTVYEAAIHCCGSDIDV